MLTGKPAGPTRKTAVTALLALLLVGAIASSSRASSAADAQDPERNATTPTGWHFWVGQTKAQIDKRAKDASERVVDVNVDSVVPLRFSAVLVRNSGPYARTGGWSYGSEADVTNKINAEQGRLIDLEPYTVSGKRRFAYVWVQNTGSAGKGWHWNYDLTVKGVTKEINKYKVRLIDLDTYVVNGKRRYSYIGIDNQGVDGRAWWWYVNVTPKFVQQQAEANSARLIDVERPKAGLMSVIMVRNDDHAYSRHVYDYTQTDLLRFQASNGVRITDLERYSKNGHVRYAASLIDNATLENRRIRAIWRSSPMANAPNGTDAWFGIYAKEVKGPADVGLANTMPYQPLSVLKLIPHLYVMDLLDKDPGLDLLDQPKGITWRALKGKPDEIWCRLQDKGKKTQIYSETLRKTLTRGLGESLNRAHEALLNKYHSATINARIHALGLTHTNVYPGCKQGGGKKDWTWNRSTLSELGRLFENVDDKTYFKNHWQPLNGEFYGLMADWNTTGIKNVVVDEAAKAGKSGLVSSFMSKVTLNGKGGGTLLPQKDGTFNGGRGFFGRLELPFRTGVRGQTTTIKTFVGGYFVDNFKAPCNEDTAASSKNQACRDWKTKQSATYDLLTGEPYRLAIRRAIATWTRP
jgi:Beta-lactamase enzyme family/Polyglycine hydrolase-like, structural repeat